MQHNFFNIWFVYVNMYKRVTVNITILLIETYFPYVFIYKMHINIDQMLRVRCQTLALHG